MEGSLAELFVILRLKDEVSGTLGESTSKMKTALGAVVDAGAGLSVISTQLQGPLDTYNELSSAAGTLAEQTGLPKEAMEELIRSMTSADTPMSEAAAMLTELGRSGITSKDQLKEVGSAIDTLADATGKSADGLAQTLVPAFAALGDGVDKIPGKIDPLATLFKETKLNVDDFAQAAKLVGPSFKDAGISSDDFAKTLGILADKGITGRRAISELKGALDESNDTNKDGKISTEELTKALSISKDEWATISEKVESSAGKADKYAQIANDAVPTQEKFNNQLSVFSSYLGEVVKPFGDVVGSMSGMGDVLPAIGGGVTTLEGIGEALKIISSGGIVTGLGSVVSGMGGMGGVISTSLLPALIPFLPLIVGLGIGLAAIWALNELGVFKWIMEQGAAFADWLKTFDIGKAFQGILDFFTNLPQTIMNALGGSGGIGIAEIIVGIIFPPAGILMLLNQFFPQIGDWFADIGNKILSFITSIDPVNIVLGIVGAIFPPAKILAEMGVGLDDVLKFFSEIPGKVLTAVSSIDPNTIVSIILGVIFPPTLILSALGVNWLDVAKWFTELPGKVLETITGAAIAAADFVNAMFPIGDILNALIDGFTQILEGVLEFITGFIDYFVELDGKIKEIFIGLLTAGLKFLTDLLAGFTDWAVNTLGVVTQWISDVTTGFVEFYTDILAKLAEWITGFTDSVVTFFADIITKLTEWITGFTSAVVDFFADIIDKLATWITDYTTAMVDFFADILTKLADWIIEFVRSVVDFFAEIITNLVNFVANFTASIVAFFADILGKLTEWATGIVAGFLQCFTDAAAAVVKPLQDLYNTIYNSLTSVWNFVKGIWDNVVKAFNDIWSRIPFIGSQAGVSGSYATGTNYVPETGIYMLHEGEAVIPAAQNNGSVGTGGSTIIQNYSGDIVLPNVTNYDEFRASMARDMRMDRTFRGVS